MRKSPNGITDGVLKPWHLIAGLRCTVHIQFQLYGILAMCSVSIKEIGYRSSMSSVYTLLIIPLGPGSRHIYLAHGAFVTAN